jgi:hypothetical protein
MTVDERRRLAPQAREGNHGVAVVKRAGRVGGLRDVGPEHPGADRKQAALALDEARRRRGEVLIEGGQALLSDLPKQFDDAPGFRRVDADVPVVGEDDDVLREQVGVEQRDVEVGRADVRLDQVRLAGPLLELPGVLEQLFRRVGSTGLPSCISPAWAISLVLTWNSGRSYPKADRTPAPP